MFIFSTFLGLGGLIALGVGLYLAGHIDRVKLRPRVEAHFGAIGRQRLRWLIVVAYLVIGISLMGAAWLAEPGQDEAPPSVTSGSPSAAGPSGQAVPSAP